MVKHLFLFHCTRKMCNIHGDKFHFFFVTVSDFFICAVDLPFVPLIIIAASLLFVAGFAFSHLSFVPHSHCEFPIFSIQTIAPDGTRFIARNFVSTLTICRSRRAKHRNSIISNGFLWPTIYAKLINFSLCEVERLLSKNFKSRDDKLNWFQLWFGFKRKTNRLIKINVKFSRLK